MSKSEYISVVVGLSFLVGAMMFVFSPPSAMTSDTIERINKVIAEKS